MVRKCWGAALVGEGWSVGGGWKSTWKRPRPEDILPHRTTHGLELRVSDKSAHDLNRFDHSAPDPPIGEVTTVDSLFLVRGGESQDGRGFSRWMNHPIKFIQRG